MLVDREGSSTEQQNNVINIAITSQKLATDQLNFSKSTKEMANHLRPLFITANFEGTHIPKVM